MSDGPRSGAGLRIEVRESVATLTLDRPDSLNALTVPLKVALLEAFLAIAAEPAIRAVILTGAGRAFCAGQDLAERAEPDAAPLENELRERYNPLVRAIRVLPQPVIAAINGVAAGAGASLALACDLRVASIDARLVLAFARLGLIPDSGLTWLLPRLVGPARAAELALIGDPLSAEAAQAIGLIGRVVPAAELMPAANEIADRLAAMAPAALSLTKRLLADTWSMDLDAGLEAEAEAQGLAGRTADHAEGLAAFREKRPPRFSGE
ncbi:MAG: enoyl-CoA hydratase-related protein [Candidatus Limnocylindrales bacterium]